MHTAIVQVGRRRSVTYERRMRLFPNIVRRLYTLCSKKMTPKFKPLELRHILSELNILLAALIIIFST